MILVQCACGQQMQVREEHAGSEVRCPVCQRFLTVPGSEGRDAPQTRFQAGEPRAEAGLDHEAFTDQAPRRALAAPDGSSNTFLVVEAANPVPWTKPADVVYNPKGPLPKFGKLLPNRFMAAVADGSTRVFDLGVLREQTIRQAINPRDGGVMGLDWNQ